MTLALLPLLMPDWLDPAYIIEHWALWGVALIIFIECAIFPVLPGDSLLFAVGMFAAPAAVHHISYGGSTSSTIIVVYSVLMVAAVSGNLVGYWVGRLIGPPLFKPRTGFWGKVFDPKHIDRTHAFFEKYGSRTLILARFVPLVRTFVTLIAGVSKMSLKTFISYTAIGGVAWVLIVTTAGYFLGGVSVIANNFELACVIIVIVSVLPMVWEWFKTRRARHKAPSPSVSE